MSTKTPRPPKAKNANVFKDLSVQFRLIMRLMGDRRVNIFLKILPIGGLIYLIVPTDLMPLLPFDDALIVWLCSMIFIELCPQNVVTEHRTALEAGEGGQQRQPERPQGDVIDAEFRTLDDRDQTQKP